MTNDNDNNDNDNQPDDLGRPGTGEKVAELSKFTAPFNQEIKLLAVEHESGLRMLRVNIRERRRFTVFDVDAKTARLWAAAMNEWAVSAED